jgi:hypothetical protein
VKVLGSRGPDDNAVKAYQQVKSYSLSSLFRKFLTSLEVSLFVLICCCRWGVCRSEALRRGLCGAFRAKRRRTPQRVLRPAIHSTSATSFSAHSLAARDDPPQAYFLRSWLSHGAAYLALPALPEVAPLDLRSPCILRDSALLLPHLPTHRPVLWLSLAHSACSAAGVVENAPGTAPPNRC